MVLVSVMPACISHCASISHTCLYKPWCYTLSEARSGVDWADLVAAQGAFGTDFYDKSTRTIVGTML